MSETSNKSDFIDEIYVPQKSDVCPTPIVDFIDEVYVPKKKDKDLTNNSEEESKLIQGGCKYVIENYHGYK